jgi:hypothetical protein
MNAADRGIVVVADDRLAFRYGRQHGDVISSVFVCLANGTNQSAGGRIFVIALPTCA